MAIQCRRPTERWLRPSDEFHCRTRRRSPYDRSRFRCSLQRPRHHPGEVIPSPATTPTLHAKDRPIVQPAVDISPRPTRTNCRERHRWPTADRLRRFQNIVHEKIALVRPSWIVSLGNTICPSSRIAFCKCFLGYGQTCSIRLCVRYFDAGRRSRVSVGQSLVRLVDPSFQIGEEFGRRLIGGVGDEDAARGATPSIRRRTVSSRDPIRPTAGSGLPGRNARLVRIVGIAFECNSELLGSTEESFGGQSRPPGGAAVVDRRRSESPDHGTHLSGCTMMPSSPRIRRGGLLRLDPTPRSIARGAHVTFAPSPANCERSKLGKADPCSSSSTTTTASPGTSFT